MSKPKILAFSGSIRKESFNQRLIENAARIAEDAGSDVSLISLGDFPMPIMNQDLEREQGQPEGGTRLKQMFVEHDGVMIASPEYNSSISPLLKNSIDWVSRKVGDEPPLLAYNGKVAAIMSASPGRLGGLRGLVHVRSILSNLGMLVLPDQLALGSAGSAFNDNGLLVDDGDRGRLQRVVARQVDLLKRLAS